MRRCSAEEALAGVRSFQQVFVHGGAATPTVLLEALAARGPELRDVGVWHLHTEGPAPHLAPVLAGHLRHHALFIGANARLAVHEGRADYVPVFLSDVPHLFARRQIPIDVALINVSPPDAHGFCSLGTSVDVALSAVRAASLVIAQINAKMPRVLGDGIVHVDDIDLGVECATPPYAVACGEPAEIEQRIGRAIADLVPDGATLQMGIGGLPGALCAALREKRDIGIHTEMFTDGVVDLVERGVVTGAKKDRNKGKVVSAFCIGSERLYRWIDDNPMVEMRGADYTNDPGVIRTFKKMVAVNSAIEIDLTGQVCADSIGDRLYSGVGGQVDFMRGAALAEEGRAIIALPSTACGGKRTRIVDELQRGAGVVTTRAHVHTVVTEYGVAELHGRGIADRARALIAIAAPEFREQLTAAARKLHYF